MMPETMTEMMRLNELDRLRRQKIIDENGGCCGQHDPDYPIRCRLLHGRPCPMVLEAVDLLRQTRGFRW